MLRERERKKTGETSEHDHQEKTILTVIFIRRHLFFFDIFITKEIFHYLNTKYQFLGQMKFSLLAEICTELVNNMRSSVFE